MKDKRLGVLYGQAVGDSLGLPAEFKSAKAINTLWPDPTWPTEFQPTVRMSRNHSWKAGEYSDDTEQAVCLLDAYLEGVTNGQDPTGPIDLLLVAKHFIHWMNTNGRGMGNHTLQVFSHGRFLTDPLYASEMVWRESGRTSAPNGAVMRTAYVGIIRPWDEMWTDIMAEDVAQVTHFDPRCVASAVAVSVAIASLCRGDTLDQALTRAAVRASRHDAASEFWILTATLAELELDEGMDKPRTNHFPPIGFTYKCLGAGFWAVREAKRRLDEVVGDPDVATLQDIWLGTLRAVIRAGGDADTNGAVAGAMLGAMLGARAIPEHLVSGLVEREGLDRRFGQLGGPT